MCHAFLFATVVEWHRAKQTAHLILTPNVHKDAIQAQPKRPGLKAPPNAHKTRIDPRLRDASAGEYYI